MEMRPDIQDPILTGPAFCFTLSRALLLSLSLSRVDDNDDRGGFSEGRSLSSLVLASPLVLLSLTSLAVS